MLSTIKQSRMSQDKLENIWKQFSEVIQVADRKNFLARYVSLSFWDLMVSCTWPSPSSGDQSGDGIARSVDGRKGSR